MKTYNISTAKSALTFALIAIGYYLQVRLNLFTCDDFRYALHQGTREPIRSLNDIFSSQCHAYQYENGRWNVHCLVQFFASFAGMEAFRVVNTIIFCLLIRGMAKIANPNNGTIALHQFPILVLALFIFLPIAGGTLLGNIACGVNYLWASCVYVWFIWLFINGATKPCARLTQILLIRFSGIAGAFQESFAIGISAAIFFYLILYRKHLTRTQILMSFCFWIGCAVLCLAPGNFLRAAALAGPTSNFTDLLKRGLFVAYHAPILSIITVTATICWKQIRKTMSGISIFLYIAAFANAGLGICVAITGPHQLTSTCLFSLLIVLNILFTRTNANTKRILSGISLAGLLILYIPVYYYRAEMQNAHNEMCNAERGYLVSEKYDKLSYGHRNWIQSKFTTSEAFNSFSLAAFSRYHNISPAITLRLPATKEHIVRACKKAPTSDGHKIAHCAYYKAFATKKAPTYFNIIKQQTYLSGLRNKILGKPDTEQELVETTALPHFSHDGHTYFIIMDWYHSPIIKITPIYSTQTD